MCVLPAAAFWWLRWGSAATWWLRWRLDAAPLLRRLSMCVIRVLTMCGLCCGGWSPGMVLSGAVPLRLQCLPHAWKGDRVECPCCCPPMLSAALQLVWFTLHLLCWLGRLIAGMQVRRMHNYLQGIAVLVCLSCVCVVQSMT